MGDVAGIGPEVIARAWLDPAFHALARPIVIGDPGVMRRAAVLVGGAGAFEIQDIDRPEQAEPSRRRIPCLAVRGPFGDLAGIPPGVVDRRAGLAAYEFLNAAIDLALERTDRRDRDAPVEQARVAPGRRRIIPVTPRSSPSAARSPTTR